MKLWTAQYRYPGPFRLDITVKGDDPVGKIFAPTWDMVKKHKKESTMYNRANADNNYTDDFKALMIASLDSDTVMWDEVLARDNVVIVCFCPYKAFCHRNLVAEYLVRMGAEYMGEIVDFSRWAK